MKERNVVRSHFEERKKSVGALSFRVVRNNVLFCVCVFRGPQSYERIFEHMVIFAFCHSCSFKILSSFLLLFHLPVWFLFTHICRSVSYFYVYIALTFSFGEDHL